MEEEIWKDIPEYEGLYQVSNLGNVKTLSRIKSNGKRSFKEYEKILKQSLRSKNGYLSVSLTKDKIQKTFNVHSLVARTFLNHISNGGKIVIDHIDNNKLNNRLENLRIITQRENAYKLQGKYSSIYKGVSWSKTMKKWISAININSKVIVLGYFNDELKASEAYNNKVENIK